MQLYLTFTHTSSITSNHYTAIICKYRSYYHSGILLIIFHVWTQISNLLMRNTSIFYLLHFSVENKAKEFTQMAQSHITVKWQNKNSNLATPVSIDRWMDKDVVHIYNGILLSHEKEWNNVVCSNMRGPRDWHAEWSQIQKENYHMISFICRI